MSDIQFKKGDRVKLSILGRESHIPDMFLWRGTVVEDQLNKWVKVLWENKENPWTEHESFITNS